MSTDKFKTPAWIILGVGVALNTAILVSFIYSNFETKSHADETRENSVQRLQRIEDKLDRLIEREK